MPAGNKRLAAQDAGPKGEKPCWRHQLKKWLKFMVEETKIAPLEEDKKPEVIDTKVINAKVENEEELDAKLGDILATRENKEVKMVPEATLLEYKKGNKELKRDIKELKEMISSGASKQEVSQELKDIAKEHNVDESFLEKLAKTIKSQARAEMEGEFSSKIKPMEEREKAEQIDKIFNEHYKKTLEAMPEFKNIASKSVIKALATNPDNAKKTFAQIIEEAFGHLVKGKRTLEPTKPRGGAGDAEIDFKRAEKDTEYFKELMSDPQMKKKYNAGLQKRLKL